MVAPYILPQKLSTFTDNYPNTQGYKKTSRIYKVEADEHADEAISALIGNVARELANEPTERISLADAGRLKKLIVEYLQVCERNSTFPSVAGLMRCAGLNRRTFYDYLNRNPETRSGQMLQAFHDSCAEILQQASLRNQCNPIVAIFMQKAIFGYNEKVEILAPKSNDPLGAKVSPEEIASRYDYLLDTAVEFDEVQ